MIILNSVALVKRLEAVPTVTLSLSRPSTAKLTATPKHILTMFSTLLVTVPILATTVVMHGFVSVTLTLESRRRSSMTRSRSHLLPQQTVSASKLRFRGPFSAAKFLRLFPATM